MQIRDDVEFKSSKYNQWKASKGDLDYITNSKKVLLEKKKYHLCIVWFRISFGNVTDTSAFITQFL